MYQMLCPFTLSPHTIHLVAPHYSPLSCSGLIGTRLPKFSIFGDTMNTSSRMESSCTPGGYCLTSYSTQVCGILSFHFLLTLPCFPPFAGRIQVSSHTFELLMASSASSPEEWEATGGVEVKGKGIMVRSAMEGFQDKVLMLPLANG